MSTMAKGPIIEIDFKGHEPEWWAKIVDFLNQNWGLLVPDGQGCVTVLFVADTSGMNTGVFDRLIFPDIAAARAALSRNGFENYADNPRFKNFIFPPELPLREGDHPNGLIYSSGRYWTS